MKFITAALTVLLFTGVPASAQEAEAAAETGWKHSLVSGLSLTQVSYTNWAQGGENSLAYKITLDGMSSLDREPVLWENQYRFGFGQTRLGSQGVRKTEDVIDISSVLTYRMGGALNPYASATFKSQFATGYKYDAANTGVPVSKFFDPAYLTQAVGIRYQPAAEIRTRLGLAMREVITDRYTKYADDPKTVEVENTGVHGGLESVTDVEWKIDENILLTSRLSVFAPFDEMDEPVVLNNTTLNAKVNSYLTAMVGFELIYEKVVSPKAQYKEGISLGLSYTLF